MPHQKIQDWQERQMVFHHKNGLSINAISKKVGLSHPAVDRFIEKYLDETMAPENRRNRKNEARRQLINKYFKPTCISH